MNEIIDEVNNYLQKTNTNYKAWSYAKNGDKYIFTYMLKVDSPGIYTETLNGNYYVPVIDNTAIEYDINTKKIVMINISTNLDVINKLKFITIGRN